MGNLDGHAKEAVCTSNGRSQCGSLSVPSLRSARKWLACFSVKMCAVERLDITDVTSLQIMSKQSVASVLVAVTSCVHSYYLSTSVKHNPSLTESNVQLVILADEFIVVSVAHQNCRRFDFDQKFHFCAVFAYMITQLVSA